MYATCTAYMTFVLLALILATFRHYRMPWHALAHLSWHALYLKASLWPVEHQTIPIARSMCPELRLHATCSMAEQAFMAACMACSDSHMHARIYSVSPVRRNVQHIARMKHCSHCKLCCRALPIIQGHDDNHACNCNANMHACMMMHGTNWINK